MAIANQKAEDRLVHVAMKAHAHARQQLIARLDEVNAAPRVVEHLRAQDLGEFRRGDAVEVSFAFDCWLGLDEFSVSLAVHSRDGISYDWLDGALFFRVTSPVLIEGVANLNASATARRVPTREGARRADAGSLAV